jgi:small subunit ribosomal protein S17
MSEQTETQKSGHRVVGRVVSNKGDKTITVLVERSERHPLYGKMLRRSTKLRAHDENNECNEGDLVAIVETRPLSATKNFRLLEVLQRASALQQTGG